MEGPKILTLMLEARLEVYQLIDTHYKPMPKKTDGSIDEYAKGVGNNDIDALRHAYVSGRYTMEFGEETAALRAVVASLMAAVLAVPCTEVSSDLATTW